MSYAEIVTEAKQLPLPEQLMLMEELMQVFRQALTRKNGKTSDTVFPSSVSPKHFTPDAPHKSEAIRSRFSADKMAGILRPAGPLPSDEDVKEMYIAYLIEKYQ